MKVSVKFITFSFLDWTTQVTDVEFCTKKFFFLSC